MSEMINKELPSHDDSIDAVFLDKLASITEKLNFTSAKLEQCVFDSINTTDTGLNHLREAIELMDKVLDLQDHIYEALTVYQSNNDTEEVRSFVHAVGEQFSKIQALQSNLYGIAHAGIEANDAARSIEHIIVEQDEILDDLRNIGNDFL